MAAAIDFKCLEIYHLLWGPSFQRRCDPVLFFVHYTMVQHKLELLTADSERTQKLDNDWNQFWDFKTFLYANDDHKYRLTVSYDEETDEMSFTIKVFKEKNERVLRLVVSNYVNENFKTSSYKQTFKMDRIQGLYESIANTIIKTIPLTSDPPLTKLPARPESPLKRSSKPALDEPALPLLSRPHPRRKFVDSSAVVIVSMETDQKRPAQQSLDHSSLDLLVGPKPPANREYKRRKMSVDCISLSSDDQSSRVSTVQLDDTAASEPTAAATPDTVAKQHRQPSSAQHPAVIKYTYNPITLYANYYQVQTSKRSIDDVYTENYGHLLSKNGIKPCQVDLTDCFRQEPLRGMKVPVILDKALKRRLNMSTKS